MNRTIVAVSPLPLENDSRSHRAALSFRRFGFDVVAVEGTASRRDRAALPFPLISLSNGRGGDGPVAKRAARAVVPGLIWECGAFAWFVFRVFVLDVVRGSRRVPRGDVYYLHGYELYPMVRALARRTGAPILYDAHDFYPGVHADADLTWFWRRVFRPFLMGLEGRCIRRAAAMVTVNAGIAELYARAFGVRARVARNCHDPAMEAAVENGIRETLGLGADAFLVVTVGNRKPGQDVAAALRAMAETAADVHLVFLGRGYEDDAAAAAAVGVSDRVHVLPPVGADEVVPFIRSADMALILYYARSENDIHFLPNGFFQAVAAGLPVAYPGLRWIKDVAGRYGIGHEIDPHDPASIRHGIEGLRARLAGSARLRDDIARAARENTWQAEEAALRDMVTEALGG